MDMKAFYKLSYGLYIVSSSFGGKQSGCVVNTLSQVTSQPAKLSVTINKDNFTEKVIENAKTFAAVALTQSADMDLIGTFGFKSSMTEDKFSKFSTKQDEDGTLYVTQQVAARYRCRVVETLDLGTHMMFIGEVLEAEVLSDEEVLTYAYYQMVKKGGTPKNAPSYKGEETVSDSTIKGYRCSVCGYILESDTVPDDFVCPICGQGPDKMVKLF